MVQIHIINLKDAERRRTFMIRQMKELSLRYEFFDAIKGSLLSDDELSASVDMNEVAKYPTWLTRNMLGAALSHMGVYKRIVNSDAYWHLVLEDDVVLDESIHKIMEHVLQNEELYKKDIVLLYGISLEKHVELLKNSVTAENGFSIHEVISKDIGGAGAYLIHKDTAKLLVENNKLIKVAPDTWHFFQSQGAIRKIYCVYPFLARPGFFESTIGYVDPGSIRFKFKTFVEKYKLPIFYYFLKRNRKMIWHKTSSVVFK